MSLVNWGLLVAAAVVGTVLGHVGHEATHAAVAWVVGATDIAVDWLNGAVYYNHDGGRLVHGAIGLAPLAIGMLVLLPGWLAAQNRLSWDVVDLGFAFGWLWYTLLGGIEDYQTVTGPSGRPAAAEAD